MVILAHYAKIVNGFW